MKSSVQKAGLGWNHFFHLLLAPFLYGILIYIFPRKFLQYSGCSKDQERIQVIVQAKLSFLASNLKSDINLFFCIPTLKQDLDVYRTMGTGLPSCLDLDNMVSNYVIVFPWQLQRHIGYLYFGS